MMTIDMTDALAPLWWGLIALLLVPAAAIVLAVVARPRVVWRSGGAVRGSTARSRGRRREPARLRDVTPSRA